MKADMIFIQSDKNTRQSRLAQIFGTAAFSSLLYVALFDVVFRERSLNSEKDH